MTTLTQTTLRLGPRRGVFVDAARDAHEHGALVPGASDIEEFEIFDRAYRALCAILYNYVPGSGHPGGSISSGRIAQAIVFDALEYDLSDPDAPAADVLSYSAGHKALGLYALWALRTEVARLEAPGLLPASEHDQLRLQDLLGFRRNPVNDTPLVKKFRARALDGHPTPATPFVKLATGASGVGVASSFGLALAALDIYRDDPPRIHVLEGEGGLTPGRVSEAFAAAATMGLRNLIVHIDWNQASIDSNRVCREGGSPGDYVQWDPIEFAHFHDWNVISVPDGTDYRQILAAQRRALTMDNGQPTAIVYRTVKGWKYGIEGRASHGAGHKLCAAGFYEAIAPLVGDAIQDVPRCEGDAQLCRGCDAAVIEACYWDALCAVRNMLTSHPAVVESFAARLGSARARLVARARRPRIDAPDVAAAFDAGLDPAAPPSQLAFTPGSSVTLRGALGDVLDDLNRRSIGAFLVSAADLVGSTSIGNATRGFAGGYFHASHNPDSRLLSIGGICEDAAAGMLSGVSAYGWHIGVGSSYAAFLAPLGHISARLHAIGGQARRTQSPNEPYKPFILVCAHAGLKTGEDGPTHADPQALQLLQENFPPETMITLTPWDPQELWPLMIAALRRRPAVIAPFVTRPSERVVDRIALGLTPASAAITGLYPLRVADPTRRRDGTVVLQDSGVAYAFVEETLPRLDREGLNIQAMYVASAELFDMLSPAEQRRIYPRKLANEAMGITGFTLPTLYRWIQSDFGRAHSRHPFSHGHYLGSGSGASVLREAGLDGDGQFEAIREYCKARARA